MEKYFLNQYSRGKVIKSFESPSCALLKLWALQNTNGKKTSIIRSETGRLIMTVTGNGTEYPKVTEW